MKTARCGALGLCLALAACGGGGGDGGSSTGTVPVVSTPSPTPGPATLAVTLSPAAHNLRATDDASDTVFTMEATQAGTTTDTVVPDIQYDASRMTLQGSIAASGGKYTATFRTAKGLAIGTYTGGMTFRLCREAACSTVYPGSTQAATYRLEVALRDWGGFQRNAAHSGYVHATFDPAAFRTAWEWTPTDATQISEIASYGATVMVNTRNTDGTTSVHALSTASGAERWFYNIGSVSYSSGPAVGDDKVFVTSMISSSDQNRIETLDATTGQFIGPMIFASQWSLFLPPTPYDRSVYMSAGYYGNVVYGYDWRTLKSWATNGSGSIWDGETPAVDDKYVYYYSGKSIDLFDRNTGDLVRSLADPFFQSSGYSYYGAPILGSQGNVMAYSGHRGSASSSPLVNWSMTTGTYAWRSADTYMTTPAVGGGFVYLARNQPNRLDALNEGTGAIAWSWSPPTGEQFSGNTIVTDTLVFASTDKAVYAISLTNPAHPAVWSATTPGDIAITGDATLIVRQKLAGQYGYSSPRKLVAYRLRS